MGPGVLWELFDEATKVRTAGDYHKFMTAIRRENPHKKA